MAKTKDLFGEHEVKYLDLILPGQNVLEAVMHTLNCKYNKNELVNIYTAFRQWTAGFTLRMVDARGEAASQGILSAFSGKPASKGKDVYSRFIAMLVADKHNLDIYFSFMPEKSKHLMTEIIRHGCLSFPEAKKIGGLHITKGYGYYDRVSLTGELSWIMLTSFDYYYGHYDDSYFYLDTSIVQLFLRGLMPEAYQSPEPQEELPDGQYTIDNFEHNVFTDIPLIEGMFAQNVISAGKTKLLTASSEKKINQLPVADLNVAVATPGLRGRMLATYIAMMKDKDFEEFDGVTLPVDEQAQVMLRNYPIGSDSGWFQACTPFVSGIKKAVLATSNTRAIIQYVVGFLKGHHDKGWLSINNIFNDMYPSLMRNGNSLFVFKPDHYNIGNLPYNDFAQKQISPDHIVDYFTKPFIRGYLYLLASWGIIETATEKQPAYDASPFDGLAYVRVTKLGRYALGVDKYYIPPVEEKKVWFELDDDRLIFRSLSDDNPYTVILADVSNAIGGGRYEVTAESFLSHCSTKEDVEQKISIFKQYIGRELPEVWKDFFAEMLRHCQPLEKLPITSYKMYRVAKDNKTLQRLLTTDEKLRSLVIRAEGYRLLVAKTNIVKFENRLKSFGYLL